jgi:hypothetical protein
MNADLVAEGENLFLVMRHEDGGDAHLSLDALQIHLHLHAERLVERAQRLVEQQHARPRDDSARQCHALALAP